MRALLVSTVAMGLLHLGCEATPTPTSDVPSSPDVEVSVAIDAGIDAGFDAGFDDIAPTPDRASDDVSLPVDIAMGVDVAPDVPRLVDVVADNGRCPVGQGRCGAACVAFETDPMNCGGCAQACTARQSCIGGSCLGEQRSCPGGGGRGCGLVEVTGGTFAQGNAMLPNYVYAAPVQPSITVSDFAIDAYEVTVGRFRRFWDAGHPDLPGDVAYPGEIQWVRGMFDRVIEPGTNQDTGCDWSRTPMGRELLPLVCVDVATAQCFCAWDGGRLPTESEWEYVAKAWPIEGLPSPRTYPWGNQRESTQCRVAQFGILCEGDMALGYLYRQVGSYPAIGGIYDLAGNINEITASAFVEYYVPFVYGGRPRVDPFFPDVRSSSGYFVVRGGRFWEEDFDRMNSSARLRLPGDERGGAIGFRCVYSRRRP